MVTDAVGSLFVHVRVIIGEVADNVAANPEGGDSTGVTLIDADEGLVPIGLAAETEQA